MVGLPAGCVYANSRFSRDEVSEKGILQHVASAKRWLSTLANTLDRGKQKRSRVAIEQDMCEPGDKRRYFRIALASAGECAAALDLFAIERDKPTAVNPRARTALDETAALTVGLIRRL